MDRIVDFTTYDSYFTRLLSIVDGKKLNNELGEEVKVHALKWLEIWNTNDFSMFENEYVRSYIGKSDELKWEAIVMSWKKGNQTRIHGHPDFASYTGLTGKLLVETFEPTVGGKCKKTSEYTITKGQSFSAVGSKGRFDNHIHRITCLSDTAHSLHIYSDDARLGVLYETDDKK